MSGTSEDVFPMEEERVCRAPVPTATAATAAAGGTTTGVVTDCDANPCLMCHLEKAIQAQDFEGAKGVTLSKEPLDLNIIGVRRRNSLNDVFDDLMVVAFRLLPKDLASEHKRILDTGDDAIVQAIKDAHKKVKEAHDALGIPIPEPRLVRCSKAGQWVVGVFPITTDPGMETRLDVDRAINSAKAQVEEFKKKLAQSQKNVQDATDAVDAAQSAVDDFVRGHPGIEVPPQAPPKDSKAKSKSKPTPDQLEVQKLVNALTKAQKALAKLDKTDYAPLLEAAKAKLDSAQKDLAAKQAGNIPVETDTAKPGWYGIGRALMLPGEYRYRFSLHKGIIGSVALTLDTDRWGSVAQGRRIWKVKGVAEEPHATFQGRPDFLPILRVDAIEPPGQPSQFFGLTAYPTLSRVVTKKPPATTYSLTVPTNRAPSGLKARTDKAIVEADQVVPVGATAPVAVNAAFPAGKNSVQISRLIRASGEVEEYSTDYRYILEVLIRPSADGKKVGGTDVWLLPCSEGDELGSTTEPAVAVPTDPARAPKLTVTSTGYSNKFTTLANLEFDANIKAQTVTKKANELNAVDFGGRNVRELLPKGEKQDKTIVYKRGQATLALSRSSPVGPMVVFIRENDELRRLDADDRVFSAEPVYGTNIHRGHSLALNGDGSLRTAGQKWDEVKKTTGGTESPSPAEWYRVGNWSEGCQVWPVFSDFNLFIRLCAASKRWRCQHPSRGAAPDESGKCSRLSVDPSKKGTATTADANISAGELALREGPGKSLEGGADKADHVGNVADPAQDSPCYLHPSAADPAKQKGEQLTALAKLEAEKAKTSWPDGASDPKTTALRGAVSALRVDGAPSEAEIASAGPEALLGKLKALVAHEKNKRNLAANQKTYANWEKQWQARWEADANRPKRDELARLVARRDQWRRDYLYDRTTTFRADYYRTCDAAEKCSVRFRYLLIEQNHTEFENVRRWLKANPGEEWDGSLILA